MNKQEHQQILSSELKKRDNFWKSVLEKEIQKVKKEYEDKIKNIQNIYKNSTGKKLEDLIRKIVKEEVAENIIVDVEKKYDPYSMSDEHEHVVSVDWKNKR